MVTKRRDNTEKKRRKPLGKRTFPRQRNGSKTTGVFVGSDKNRHGQRTTRLAEKKAKSKATRGTLVVGVEIRLCASLRPRAPTHTGHHDLKGICVRLCSKRWASVGAVRNAMTNIGLILRIRILIRSKRIRGAPCLYTETPTNLIITGSCTQLGAYGKSCRRKFTSTGVDLEPRATLGFCLRTHV